MSFTLAYTGAEIDALLGKIDAIFVAEYGSTIYSEVTAAIAAGNKVIVANAGKVFVYAGTDDNSGYVFTQSGPNASKPNATYVTLSTASVWSTATVDLATLQQFYASLMEDTASGSIASFPDGANGVPVAELSCEIVPVQSGSGDPSPDNIRPISGYTGAEITRTGKQLFDKTATDPAKGYHNGSYLYADGTNGNYAGFAVSEYIKVKPSTDYTISGISGNAPSICFYDKDRNFLSGSNYANASAKTVTSPATAAYCRVSIILASIDALQLEEGTTASPYEAFGTVYSVSWTDHGTVYKGNLNATTGVLTITHLLQQYTGASSVGAYGGNKFYLTPPNDCMSVDYCNLLEAVGTVNAGSLNNNCVSINEPHTNVYIRNDAVTTAAEWQTIFTTTPLVIVYKLGTPQTVQLTPTEVQTLLGDNNIWSNTGDISVKYRANTALYIEKKLGE